MRRFFAAFILFFGMPGCGLFPRKEVGALRPTTPSEISDGLDFYGLPKALEVTASRLLQSNGHHLRIGEYQISKGDYAQALLDLKSVLDQPISQQEKENYIKENFLFLEMRADSGWGEAYVTGYYAPRFEGKLRKSKKHSAPIYGVPDDLVKIDIAAYYKANPGLRRSGLLEQIRDGQLRGRLVKHNGRTYVVPYHDRSEVASAKLKAEVICYLEPVDAFFLEIQGSGEVVLPNGKVLILNYADQNGHPYYPIGKALVDKIPIEQMSMQRIESHLQALPRAEQQRILNLNPSFVFFRVSDQKALTAFGVEAISARSIATDTQFLPHGALVHLTYPDPDNLKNLRSQYVLNHDTGGAIRGAGRVDIFFGHGNLAAALSGGLKGPGSLKVLFPKISEKQK